MSAPILLFASGLALSCQRPPELGLLWVEPEAKSVQPEAKNCVAPTESSRDVMLFFDDTVGKGFALKSFSFSIDGCEVFGDSAIDAIVEKTRLKQTWITRMAVPRDRAVVAATRLRFETATGEVSEVKSERTLAPHEPSLKLVAYAIVLKDPRGRPAIRYEPPYRPKVPLFTLKGPLVFTIMGHGGTDSTTSPSMPREAVEGK